MRWTHGFLSMVLFSWSWACGGDDGASPMDASPGRGDGGADAACVPSDGGTLPPLDGGPSAPLCEGSPCGGDLTGAWEILAVCAEGTGDGTFLRCADGTLTMRSIAVSGTWTFAADGTVTLEGSESATADAFLPLACYGVADCAGVQALAAAGGLSSECVGAGELDARCRPRACDCRLTLSEPALMASATYAADASAGTFVLMTEAETIEGEHCVEGDELWLSATRFGGVQYRYRMRRMP